MLPWYNMNEFDKPVFSTDITLITIIPMTIADYNLNDIIWLVHYIPSLPENINSRHNT